MEEQNELDIITTLIAGTLVVFAMAVAIIASVIKYQRNVLKQREEMAEVEKRFQTELLDASISASEKEREAVARNIHDDLGVLTNVIKLNNSQIKTNLKNESAALELINANNQLLLEVNDNIRGLLNDLASPTLMKLGFMKALKQLCSKFPSSLEVSLNFEPADMRFDKRTEIQLFRSCKEIIANILKHANATELNINVSFEVDILTIEISYNGQGIGDEDVKSILQKSKGLGLKSIYSRMLILNGTVNYLKNMELNKVLLKVPVSVLVNV